MGAELAAASIDRRTHTTIASVECRCGYAMVRGMTRTDDWARRLVELWGELEASHTCPVTSEPPSAVRVIPIAKGTRKAGRR